MERQASIKLLAFDVDGVLTDGILYYGSSGDMLKGFSARDGMGISLARAGGLKTAVITGRQSRMVEQRSHDLCIDIIIQNAACKLAAMEQICRKLGIGIEEAAYMGDDLNDAALIARAGLGGTPSDGCAEARQAAAFISSYAGGHGALREFAEYILKRQNAWDAVVSRYFSGQTVMNQ